MPVVDCAVGLAVPCTAGLVIFDPGPVEVGTITPGEAVGMVTMVANVLVPRALEAVVTPF